MERYSSYDGKSERPCENWKRKDKGEARREARKHRDMKSCKKCFQEFDDSETSDDNPARDLGGIFVSDMGNIGIEDISPKCREELGIISIISFTHY